MSWIRILPTVAVLTLAGAGIGIHLGRTAIGAIDPFYFTDPRGSETYASLVPNPPSFTQSEGLTPTGADQRWRNDCSGCPPYESPFQPWHDGSEDAYVASAWTSEPMPVTGPALYEVQAESIDAMQAAIDARIERELRLVERYAYYPVSRDAAETHAAVGPPRNEAALPESAALPKWEREGLTY